MQTARSLYENVVVICGSPASRERRRRLAAVVTFGVLASVLIATGARAQEEDSGFTLVGGNIKDRAEGALSLMAFSVVPDLAGSYLSINSSSTSNPKIFMTQTGGGFTLGEGIAPYVEGSVGFSRYDPKFVATDGQEQRRIPTKWNTITGTGGIGVDFPLIGNLKFRPMFNFSLGHVESDSSAAARYIEAKTDAELAFLHDGRLNAYGLGGSAVLDYGQYRGFNNLELQLRYTNIWLKSFDASDAVQGEVNAATVSAYGRWRAALGLTLMRRPVRYVLEGSNSTYVGDQRGVLGFNYLSSIGTGLELDTSAVHTIVSRVRYVVRYFVGENVNGVSGGIALSF